MDLSILSASQQTIVLISMLVYMGLVVAIGLMYSKRNKNIEEFYLGGRSLGPWVTAMSAEASDMSSWLLMGLPGVAFLSGYAEAGWTAIGLALGTYLNWKLVAYRLRNYTQIAGNAITLPDFFSNRFHDKRRILMTIAAVIIAFFFVIYTSAGFVACGKLFNSLFGIDYGLMMIISALVILLYTIIGGFLAESTVDFFQGILMFIALITIVFVGVNAAGGIGGVSATVASMEGFGSMFTSFDRISWSSSPISLISTLSWLAWGLGYFGMPHVLLRFMAIKNPKELKKSRIVACTWCFITLIAAVLIGIVGAAAVPDMLDGLDKAGMSSKSETIFVVLAQILGSNGTLLTILAGLMLSGILAAQMSTSDSQLLVASSAISQNFFKGVLKTDASEKQVMWVSRATILVITIIAAILALSPSLSIFDIVSYAWAGFGAAFGPLILFSLFWKRTTLAGAVAGMVSGGLTVIIWKNLLSQLGGVFAIYELLPAFIISCIFIYVVSLMTEEPSSEILDEFQRAKEGRLA
ncbi:MAG: sodium/proline symporter PutP [Christensenellales bacterium]|jgi:sodium/proline symporter